MKYALAFVVLTVVIPVFGQEKGPQARPHKDETTQLKQAEPQTPPTIKVTNQQTPTGEQNRAKANANTNAESYFSRLFAPESLPNIGLFLAGIVGICVAIRTLRPLRAKPAFL